MQCVMDIVENAVKHGKMQENKMLLLSLPPPTMAFPTCSKYVLPLYAVFLHFSWQLPECPKLQRVSKEMLKSILFFNPFKGIGQHFFNLGLRKRSHDLGRRCAEPKIHTSKALTAPQALVPKMLSRTKMSTKTHTVIQKKHVDEHDGFCLEFEQIAVFKGILCFFFWAVILVISGHKEFRFYQAMTFAFLVCGLHLGEGSPMFLSQETMATKV